MVLALTSLVMVASKFGMMVRALADRPMTKPAIESNEIAALKLCVIALM
jgi:hypothetical protein